MPSERLKFWINGSNELPSFDSIAPSNMTGKIKLRFGSYPKHMWTLSASILVASAVTLTYPTTEDTIWKARIVSAILALLSITIFITSKVEIAKLNKELGTLVVKNKTFLQFICRSGSKNSTYYLDDILNIAIEHHGTFNGDLDTRTHKIKLCFRDGSSVSLLESRSGKKTNHRVAEMQAFLESAGNNSPSRKNTSPSKLRASISSSSHPRKTTLEIVNKVAASAIQEEVSTESEAPK